jgi:trimethylamine---corrinoid protein Co-methyltransferase
MRPAESPRRRRSGEIVQQPWQLLTHSQPPARLASDDEIAALHEAALHILEEIGVRCLVPAAQSLMARAGAKVDSGSGLVRLGRDIVESALRSVPRSFTLVPRNAARSVAIGGQSFTTTAVMGPPNCTDLARGRRTGTMADLRELLQLTQFFNVVQMNGWPVEPLDVEVRMRHLEATRAMLLLTDKVPYIFCQNARRIEDALNLCALARGETLEQFAERPGAFSIINTNTPLNFDVPMTIGIMEMARFGQPVLITPFVMAGASTPATLTSAMALTHAEVLFGVALSQLVRAGAPVVYGCASMNVDMRTGAPAYGSPDMARGHVLGGQLARAIGLPLRASNFSSSNIPDFASGYESALAVHSALAAGANILMHGAGWVEGGLCTSYEKFVLDCEIIQGALYALAPVPVDPDSLALDEIRQVGPSGHFFGTERTLATVETAFYRPLISITQNHGAWVEAGSKDAAARATKIWQQALASWQPPELDRGRIEQMDEFVAQRRAQGGAPMD